MDFKLLRGEQYERKLKGVSRSNKQKIAKIVRDELEVVRNRREKRHVNEVKQGKQLDRNEEKYMH